MRKLHITVGQCLALLLWLAVQTPGAASVVSLFCLLAPVESAAAAADHQESATMRRFERALAKVQPLLERYGYGAAFAAVMAEGMGIPPPGQTLLMAGAPEAPPAPIQPPLLPLSLSPPPPPLTPLAF